MKNHINDDLQRQRALDPTQSFIVQAPAGSGKTELLTRRFLKLLGTVNHPEEILAITFTKKSSAEMRDRIISALEKAATSQAPETAHAKVTWQLAKQALHQDQKHQWNLLDNPNRLRIQTIDSFNAWLARQLPTLSHFGAALDIADEPIFLYQEAVQEFLSHLEENVAWSDAIEQLLWHLDNDLNKVELLLIKMLQKRDQWLPYITLNASDPLLRDKLEDNLSSIVNEALENLHQEFPKHESEELLFLAKSAAQNLIREQSTSPIIYCETLDSLPGSQPEDAPAWLGLAKLLFTEKLEWRKRLDKTIGFPPSKQRHDENLKERMNSLIEYLSTHTRLHNAFKNLHAMPNHQYQEKQWEILVSLHQVLQIVVAQLKLVFQQHGKVDYIENAHAALLALGDESNPTDLALALDYKIHHILVDEFQDTSNSQFRLIEKLIMGWEPNDGRTLFLVGDPMQSIYRFREAEVGLFIRARQSGIRNLYLEPLSLCVNFRSTPGIVTWVNHHFQTVLPSYEDISTGAISFCPSTSANDDEKNSEATLHPFINSPASSQAEAIVTLIKTTQENYPNQSIAILVRSRSHLEHIIPALKKANLEYQALDIDPLISRPVIQDLIALTKAFLHPGYRIAWLSMLRSPWSGLTLQDLLIISQQHSTETILERLANPSVIDQLTENGKNRLARIAPIIKQRMSERRRSSLRNWIETTWYLLGGPASVNQISDLDDAATFFKLLEKIDEGSDLIHFDYLDKAIDKLFASPNSKANASLQIMTIHNSKGLEFDTVILPHLEARTPHDEKQLLLWMERSQLDRDSQLIIAPVHAIGDETDPIYEYIKKQHGIKSDFESGRLLYVAATRAKKQLHLFFSLTTNNESNQIQPPAHGLVKKLWPGIKETLNARFEDIPISSVENDLTQDGAPTNQLKRLPEKWTNSFSKKTEAISIHQKSTGFLLPNHDPKYIGTLIHKILENICRFGDKWWVSQTTSQQTYYINKQLIQAGMLSNNITSATDIITRAIHNTLNDSRGKWIITNHQEDNSEFKLTAVIDQSVQQLVIDRTFIDESGTRWIIDYKSSCPNEVDLDVFLRDEQKKYAPQMQSYHQAMQAFNQHPIRLGLYFPLIPAWYEWELSHSIPR